MGGGAGDGGRGAREEVGRGNPGAACRRRLGGVTNLKLDAAGFPRACVRATCDPDEVTRAPHCPSPPPSASARQQDADLLAGLRHVTTRLANAKTGGRSESAVPAMQTSTPASPNKSVCVCLCVCVSVSVYVCVCVFVSLPPPLITV
mgnify:CR=1 FL=1